MAELDLLVLSKLLRSMVSTMLSLLLRGGVSNICSIDGKDIHYQPNTSKAALMNPNFRSVKPPRENRTLMTVQHVNVRLLLTTTFCGLEVDMRYDGGGLGPGLGRWWSVMRKRSRRRLVVNVEKKTLRRNTSVFIHSCACGAVGSRGRGGSDGPAPLRAPADGVSRCWRSGEGRRRE